MMGGMDPAPAAAPGGSADVTAEPDEATGGTDRAEDEASDADPAAEARDARRWRRAGTVWQDGFGRAATRSAQSLLIITVVVIVSYVLITLRLVVVPVLIAVLIAAALGPLISLLARRGLPRGAGAGLALLTGLALLGGLGWLIGDAVADQFDQLQQGALDGIEQLQGFATDTFGLSQEQIDSTIDQVTQAAQGAQVQAGAVSGATLVGQVVTGIVLAVVVLFYLLKDAPMMFSFVREQFPEDTHERLDAVAHRSTSVLGGYVRGTAIVAFVDAVLIGIGLFVVGVPLALPLSLVVFVGAFIPLIGAVLAGAFAALIALVSVGPLAALIVLGIVVAVNQIEGNLLAPYVLGRNLSLHPLVVLLALAAGTIVAGVIGAILAVPLAAVTWGAVSALREFRAHDEEVRRRRAEAAGAGHGARLGSTVVGG